MAVPSDGAGRPRPEVLLRLGDEQAAFQVEDLFDGFALYLPIRHDDNRITDFVLVFVDPDGLLFLPVDDQLGQRMTAIFPDAVSSGTFDACVAVAETGTPQRFRFQSPTSVDQWIEAMAVRSGEYVALIYTDVSENVRTERGLLESVAEFRSLTQTMPDVVMRFDADLRITFANAAAAGRLRGRDVIGWPVERFLAGGRYTKYIERLHRVAETGSADRFDYEADDMWYEIRLVPEVDEHGRLRAVLSLGRDVTLQRRARAERERTLRRLRTQAGLLDRATDAINVREINGLVTYWNPAAEQLYGWTAEEAIGSHIDDLVNGGRHEAGLEITAALERDHEWRGRVNQVDKSGRPLLVELRLTVVEGNAGDVDHVLAIASDVTQRVALEERLVQAQKLESVGQLTGGVAHDFNNLLTVIIGGAEVLGLALRDDPQLGPVARMVQAAGQKGADLTSRLLAFSRRQPLQPRVVDLAATITSMSDLLRRTIGELVDIELRLEPELRPVVIDPGQFENALVNLCINARDAMPDGGRLLIETRNCDDAALGADGRVDPHVAVVVSDNGHGMPRHVLDHVFDPFFTTKDVGKGSGLGLSMVHGFVNQSGGSVSITSQTGSGTTVTLHLPAARPADIAASTGATPAHDVLDETPAFGLARTKGGETILLVEDDDDVRAYASSVLRGLGYTVIEAGDGHDALSIIGGDEQIDLLFTDIVMPGRLSGWQVAQVARGMRPALRVLYTSGYSEHAVGEDDRPVGAILRKPYRRRELALHVRASLDDVSAID